MRTPRALAPVDGEVSEEISRDDVELAVSVEIDGEGARAEGFATSHPLAMITARSEGERLLVGAENDLGFSERAVIASVQRIEKPRRAARALARVRAGEDVDVPIGVEVHELWSRARASADAGHFGRLTARENPLSGCEGAILEPAVDAHPATGVLPDDEVVAAVSIEVVEGG